MIKRLLSASTISLLVTALLLSPVQASGFAQLQPYLSNYKIGFTNGAKLTTPAIYDEFELKNQYAIVKKANKKGVLDLKTGKELIIPLYDNVEIPDSGNVAILWKGSSARYYNLQTRTLSTLTFQGAPSFYLSDQYSSVIALSGAYSMLVDSSGKVLVPPFKGKIHFVDLLQPDSGSDEKQSSRYLVLATNSLSLLDPKTFKPLCTIPNAKLVSETNYEVPYLPVSVNGKVGAVDARGEFILPPAYKSITFLQNGYIQIQSDQGFGLARQGKILAEPVYDEVGLLYDRSNSFTTTKGQIMTYHSLDSDQAIAVKKNNYYLGNGNIIGQDEASGLYTVKNLNNDTVVPGQYTQVETGVSVVLTRTDGKKGVLVTEQDRTIKEPEMWFDSVLNYGFDFLIGKEGINRALLLNNGRVIVPPTANLVVTFKNGSGGNVLVKDQTGKETEYDYRGQVVEPGMVKTRPFNDYLELQDQVGKGTYLVKKSTGEIIDHPYNGVYVDDAAHVIVAFDGEGADLYTQEGIKINQEVRIPLDARFNQPDGGPPVVFYPVGGSVYAFGMKPGEKAYALLKLSGDQLKVLTDFVYTGIVLVPLNDQPCAFLIQTDGVKELYSLSSLETDQVMKLSDVEDYLVTPNGQFVFLKIKGSWDAYNPQLVKVTSKQYQSVEVLSEEADHVLLYQEAKTGLYGLLRDDLKELTPAKYSAIRIARNVFPELYFTQGMPAPFVYTSGKYFGYLTSQGVEILHMAYMTQLPKVTYQPMKPDTFPELSRVMAENSLELVSFDKPFQYRLNADTKKEFFRNVALYFNLPETRSPQEIVAYLKSKQIIAANQGTNASEAANSSDAANSFTDTDFYSLAYYIVTGTPSTLSDTQLDQWGYEHQLYFEMSPHIQRDPYWDYNTYLVNRLLFLSKEKLNYTVKKIDAGHLSREQKNMLSSLILVNGLKYESLRLPLGSDLENAHLRKLVSLYNQTADQLIREYIQKNIH